MNVAITKEGNFVEIQGSAENGGTMDRQRLDKMVDLASIGCRRLMALQNEALK